MQSIESIETYVYGTSKDLICKKEKIECNNVYSTTIQKMINFDDVVKEGTKKRNPNWPQIPDHSYRTLITGGSG